MLHEKRVFSYYFTLVVGYRLMKVAACIWLPGTPFRINVDATDNGHYVSAYGAGLVQGASGQRLQFSVTRGSPLTSL